MSWHNNADEGYFTFFTREAAIAPMPTNVHKYTDKNGRKIIRIIGTRGIPATHGGFETFAQNLACYLRQHGWNVIVYCQSDSGFRIFTTQWNGITLVHVPGLFLNPFGTALYDLLCILHACQKRHLILTLGYNTAIFCVFFRLFRINTIINMDGLEWKRKKWPLPFKIWLLLNERIGAFVASQLVADHPLIKEHLSRFTRPSKIEMIPYGATAVQNADANLLKPYRLDRRSYCLVVARPEPENSIYEIVKVFSEKPRGIKLAILGNYYPDRVPFHKVVVEAAGEEVLFLGGIFDKNIVQSLRYHALFYIHGHQVGGTNPSLVEAMAAGNAVLAHKNDFNTWVAGAGALYFSSEEELGCHLDRWIHDSNLLAPFGMKSRMRHHQLFNDEAILEAYQNLLLSWLPGKRSFN